MGTIHAGVISYMLIVQCASILFCLALQAHELLHQLRSSFGVWQRIARPSDAHELPHASATMDLEQLHDATCDADTAGMDIQDLTQCQLQPSSDQLDPVGSHCTAPAQVVCRCVSKDSDTTPGAPASTIIQEAHFAEGISQHPSCVLDTVVNIRGAVDAEATAADSIQAAPAQLPATANAEPVPAVSAVVKASAAAISPTSRVPSENGSYRLKPGRKPRKSLPADAAEPPAKPTLRRETRAAAEGAAKQAGRVLRSGHIVATGNTQTKAPQAAAAAHNRASAKLTGRDARAAARAKQAVSTLPAGQQVLVRKPGITQQAEAVAEPSEAALHTGSDAAEPKAAAEAATAVGKKRGRPRKAATMAGAAEPANATAAEATVGSKPGSETETTVEQAGGNKCCRRRQMVAMPAQAQAATADPGAVADLGCPKCHWEPQGCIACTAKLQASPAGAADCRRHAQSGAAGLSEQSPRARRVTPSAQDHPAEPPQTDTRAARAANRAAAARSPPPAVGKSASASTGKRQYDEESDGEQLAVRPMPARQQRRRLQSPDRTQFESKCAPTAQRAGPVPAETELDGVLHMSEKAGSAGRISHGDSAVALPSDERGAHVCTHKSSASPQSPEQSPEGDNFASAATAAASDGPRRSSRHQKAENPPPAAAAATNNLDAADNALAADAAAASDGPTLPAAPDSVRRSGRSRKATEKAAELDGSFAAMAKGSKLISGTVDQDSSQPGRAVACSPSSRSTRRAGGQGVTGAPEGAAPSAPKPLIRKRHKQQARPALHTISENYQEDGQSAHDAEEEFTKQEVHTDPDTAKFLNSSLETRPKRQGKMSADRKQACNAANEQPQQGSAFRLAMLVEAAVATQADNEV